MNHKVFLIILSTILALPLSGCNENSTDVPVKAPVEGVDLCPDFDNKPINTIGEAAISYEVGPIIALCNGWLLVSNKTKNTIEKRNIFTNEIDSTYQLSAEPYEFALDSSLGSLFVTHGPSTFISRISLSTGDISELPVETGAQSVATSNDGKVFVNRNSGSTIDIINGRNLSILNSISGIKGVYLHYNDTTDRLINSSSNFYFDDESNNLTLQGASNGGGSGSDCNRVVVSPDGDHAAKPCGGGSGVGYSVYNFYSHDPSVVFGEWQTGAYPSGAAFGPSNFYILLTNRFDIQLFDVDTHALIISYPVSSCSYGDTRRLAISRDGQSLYSVTNCGFDDESAIIKWSLYDTTR